MLARPGKLALVIALTYPCRLHDRNALLNSFAVLREVDTGRDDVGDGGEAFDLLVAFSKIYMLTTVACDKRYDLMTVSLRLSTYCAYAMPPTCAATPASIWSLGMMAIATPVNSGPLAPPSVSAMLAYAWCVWYPSKMMFLGACSKVASRVKWKGNIGLSPGRHRASNRHSRAYLGARIASPNSFSIYVANIHPSTYMWWWSRIILRPIWRDKYSRLHLA